MASSAPISVLRERHLLLGVCGSIAAYKAVELASRLTQAGAKVDVLMTTAATSFVSSLSFQSVTGRRAYSDADLWGSEAHILHVGLAHGADMLILAPATANTLAKLARGQADNLVTITALALRCPLLIAPAMDAGMFEHPATQANLALLRERGATLTGPEEGRMASGMSGVGRMTEPEELIGHIRRLIGRAGPLAGRKVIVTAGGTQEAIDPVRVLANRSSGKQGFALAQAAVDLGADVLLITGPVSLPTPVGVIRQDVQTAEEMRTAVLDAVNGAYALLMAAAVADFRPAKIEAHKVKRGQGGLDLHLVPTQDILGQVAAARKRTGMPKVVVGFAAESQDLRAQARGKLEAKGLSLIVANDISATDAGFGVDTNRVTLIDADDNVQELPLLTKTEVAEEVLERVVKLLA